MNSLACYYLLASEYETSQETFEKLLANGMNCINMADNTNLAKPETWVTKNFYKLSKGSLNDEYKDHFQHSGYSHPLIFLFRALVEFNKGNYQESLKLFKQILEQNPLSPVYVRYGIGLCYYRLGDINKARFAFERVLELDPNNSQALISLAILETSLKFYDQQINKKIQGLLNRAFTLDSKNPLTLKYLAQHHFSRGKLDTSQKICLHALKCLERFRRPEASVKENPNFRKEMEFLKSEFNFILGKISHSQENYEDALKFYLQAVKLNQQNFAA